MSGDTEAREGEQLYTLRANFMRYVRTIGYKPNGQAILEPKRYEQGDDISLSDEEAARYLRSGAMVPKGEFDPEKVAEEDAARRAKADVFLQTMAADPTRAGQVGGKLVGLEDAPAKTTEEPHEVDGIKVEDVEDLKDPDDDEEATEDTVPSQDVPDIDNLDYPSMVQLAKTAGLGGGGTKEELRERLHEYYDGK